MIFKRSVKKRLGTVDDLLNDYQLPSFPGVITDALSRLSDPEVDMVDVARVLELDPGLSVKLLRLANSPSMGLRSPVESLQQAIMILGRNQVESVLISAAVTAAIPQPASPVFDAARFWRTAASRAVVANEISSLIDPARRSEAFTAALLQDMALPVLVDHVPGYDRLLKGWYDGDFTDLAAAEAEAFGWDHASVAVKIGAGWDFPVHLLEAIGLHHDQHERADMATVQLVGGWHETDDSAGRASLLRQAADHHELGDHDVDLLIDRALENVDEVAALFS